MHELVGVGPFEIKIRRDLLPEIELSRARLLVNQIEPVIRDGGDWSEFSVEKILDHEVVVIETMLSNLD